MYKKEEVDRGTGGFALVGRQSIEVGYLELQEDNYDTYTVDVCSGGED